MMNEQTSNLPCYGNTIVIPAMSQTYPVYIGKNIIYTHLLPYLIDNAQKRFVIITDSNLVKTLGKGLEKLLLVEKINVTLLSFPAGERHKTREVKQELEDLLLVQGYSRDTCLIALGGGVVTDLVGFLAATYCRGIPVIYIPTTLLAMVDASIGGKTGVNTSFGKNLIGAFSQPNAVFMDITLLESLPESEWQNGIVEILKHGLIRDAALFQIIKNNINHIKEPEFLLKIINESCAIKQVIVEQDVHDSGIRQLLNFGHTIGHAIEMIEDYQINHGEAVAIGMIVEAYLSVLCGYLDISAVYEIEHVLKINGLPLQTRAFHHQAVFKKAMGMDKKALSNIPHFVLLDGLGKTHQENKKYVFSVEAKILDQALDWAKAQFLVS